MASLNELKIAAVKRGIMFVERLSEVNGEAIALEIHTLDPSDRLKFCATHHIFMSDYLDSGIRYKAYYDGIELNAKAIKAREEQDIATCKHEYITNFNEKVCTKCRGKFGQIAVVGNKVNMAIQLPNN